MLFPVVCAEWRAAAQTWQIRGATLELVTVWALCSSSLLSLLAEPFQDTDDLGEQSLRERPPAVVPVSQHELEQLLLRSLLAHVSWNICCS